MRIQIFFQDGTAGVYAHVVEDSLIVKAAYISWEVDNKDMDIIYVPTANVKHFTTLIDEPTKTKPLMPIEDADYVVVDGKEYWKAPF
jgi:hypothetical protein